VCVATYAGSPSAFASKEDGLPVTTIEEATKTSDVIMILIPDENSEKVYKASIEPHLRAGQTLMFAHGSISISARLRRALRRCFDDCAQESGTSHA